MTGDAALNGILQMNLIGGMGQFRGTRSFDVLDWTGSLNGTTFSTLQLPMFGGMFTWDTSQLYTSGVLTLTGPPPRSRLQPQWCRRCSRLRGLAQDRRQSGGIRSLAPAIWNRGRRRQRLGDWSAFRRDRSRAGDLSDPAVCGGCLVSSAKSGGIEKSQQLITLATGQQSTDLETASRLRRASLNPSMR